MQSGRKDNAPADDIEKVTSDAVSNKVQDSTSVHLNITL